MTIDIAFIPDTHTSFDLKRYEHFKKYRFICTYLSIREGDIITSSDYNNQKMIVTKVHPRDTSVAYLGIPLKTISINTFIRRPLMPCLNPEEMDKRHISITHEEAREWYKGGNATLRKLALTAFTESELKMDSYEQIMKEIDPLTTCSCLIYPTANENNIKALNKLRNIAYFLNEGWHKETLGDGFFLSPTSPFDEYNVVEKKRGWHILKHSNVKYPGIVYFKSSYAAIKALEIAYEEGWLPDLIKQVV